MKLGMSETKPKSQLEQYMATHTDEELKELLEEISLVTDDLGRALLKRLAEPERSAKEP